MTSQWQTAWITGASSGIGRELALRLSKMGVQVAVSARSSDKLEALARVNANILPVPFDVTNRLAAAEACAHIERVLGPIDLVVLNAGTWDPMGALDFGAERAARMMDVNYGGVANTLEPILARMIERRRGHIALVASVAGYRGLPKAIGYAPTKAAIISLAEVLRVDLAATNITVTLINPGFVDTPMTAVNAFPMPFKLTVEDAAERIVKGLQQRRFEISFPWQLVSMLKLLRILPYPLYFFLVRRFITKN